MVHGGEVVLGWRPTKEEHIFSAGVAERLAQEIKGKIHIDVYPSSMHKEAK
jgi:TRAP-type C4-dicarboxylate transport system substrate-binding protein